MLGLQLHYVLSQFFLQETWEMGKGVSGVASAEAPDRLLHSRRNQTHLGAKLSRRKKSQGKVVATYDYRDPEGRLLFQVVRYQSGRLAQRRPDGQDGWVWNLKGVRRVLYRLPELLAAPDGTAVYIPLEEEEVEALVTLGVVATCNAGGPEKFTSDLRQPLKGMSVFVLTTKKTNRKHAHHIANVVSTVADKVKVLELPGQSKDVTDWVAAGGTREGLERLAEEAPKWNPDQPFDEGQPAGGQLPVILVNDRHLRDIVADSWIALQQANDPPAIFQRGHLMVDVILDDKGQPAIRTLDKAAFKGYLDRLTDFVSISDDGEKPARPPADVVADMMAARELPLPALQGIVQSPVLAPPGILATESGYQPETRFYLNLEKGLVIPLVPESPDRLMVGQAVSLLLDDLLLDFPLLAQADWAHAVAALLLPFVRLLIDGATPLHLVEAPTPGSGKGLLVDALTIPAAGRGPAIMTEGRDEDEWRKRITSKLLQGPQFILIDNVRSRLDSAALSAALTSETWEDRILGHSRTAQLPVTCTWLATANNPGLSLEVARRTVSIRLDPAVEKPWLRNGFKHPKLRRWAKQNRGRLIWAALTLIQAWIATGMPPGKTSLGSYESWSEVMGGILEVAGIPGFLGNMGRVYSEADQEVLAWGEFCIVWWEEFQSQQVTTDLLLGLATRKLLLVDLWGERDNQGARVSFGKALSRMRDRIISGFRIRWAGEDTRNKVQTYRLERVSNNAPTPQSAGDAGDDGEFSAPEKQDSKNIAFSIIATNPSKAINEDNEGRNFRGQESPVIPRVPRNDPWDPFLDEEE
jgi:hypothetical protein